MKRLARVLPLAMLVAIAAISSAYGAQTPLAALPTARSTAPIPEPKSTLKAIELIPVNRFPAEVLRDKNAERGTLTLTVPGPLAAAVTAHVRSDTAGVIGRASRVGQQILFRFSRITYAVAPISLPGGLKVGAQRIALDSSQPNTLTLDLRTGKLTRNFHWLLTATNAEYDGRHTLALGDTGQAGVARVTKLGYDRYSIRLLTLWRSQFTLKTWTVAGKTLPSGKIEAKADFDGTYILDFGK